MKRTIIGIALTIAVLAIVTAYSIGNWDAVSKLAPNEFGDSLAGVAATLALIWIVVGYFQQGEELRENTKALNAQQRDLEAQATERPSRY